MRKNWLLIGIAAFVAIFAIAAVACDDGDDKSASPPGSTTTDVVCLKLSAVATPESDLENIGPDTTVEEAQGHKDKLSDAVDDVKSAASDVEKETGNALDDATKDALNALDDARNGLDDAIDDLPGEEEVADGVDDISRKVGDVTGARTTAQTTLNCD